VQKEAKGLRTLPGTRLFLSYSEGFLMNGVFMTSAPGVLWKQLVTTLFAEVIHAGSKMYWPKQYHSSPSGGLPVPQSSATRQITRRVY